MPGRVSCGVLITDGRRLLLGHASKSPRWDIPKGLAEPGETLLDAAVRELKEETGLIVAPKALAPLGVRPYLRDKQLALFAWRPAEMPEPQLLSCSSMIDRPGYTQVPEFDRFDIFPFDTAVLMVGKNLARVLAELRRVICE